MVFWCFAWIFDSESVCEIYTELFSNAINDVLNPRAVICSLNFDRVRRSASGWFPMLISSEGHQGKTWLNFVKYFLPGGMQHAGTGKFPIFVL